MSAKKPETKISRVLIAFVRGKTFNRFEAERELSDHCLHSTVAEIEKYGVRVYRTTEVVPGYEGVPTRVKRYRILPADRKQARELAKKMRRPRAAATTRGLTEGQAHVRG